MATTTSTTVLLQQPPLVQVHRAPPILTMTSSSSITVIPTVGDVLMLSQTAWRTGRAFTSGRKYADQVPQEFIDVELELSKLSQVLKQLAELLASEFTESFIAQGEEACEEGIAVILRSCRKTLEELESMTSLYQSNRKSKTANGFTIERLWNRSLLENHETFVWTADGGNLQHLYELLRMHALTVNTLKSVLERFDVPGFELGIPSIAEKILELKDCAPNDLTSQMAEIRGLSQAIGFDPPSPSALIPPTPSFSPSFNMEPSTARSSLATVIHKTDSGSKSPKSPKSPKSFHSPKASPQSHDIPQKDTQTTPSIIPGVHASRMDSLSPKSLPITPQFEKEDMVSHRTSGNEKAPPSMDMTLPPPAWEPDEAPTPMYDNPDVMSHFHSIQSTDFGIQQTEITHLQQEEFERSKFRNAIILCNVRGTLVEFVNQGRDHHRSQDSSGDRELEEAMTEGRICLVREKKMYKDGRTVFTLSIWAFSDDLGVRFEQRLDEATEIIPFTSYFQQNKVSITVPTKVLYHPIVPTSAPVRTSDTRWVNYYFLDEAGSREFQNQIFGRTLRATFKTEKTMRIHEGLTSIVSAHEQMCGMENLRVWYDDDSGGYLVLIHFSALFRKGYLKFYLNNANCPIVIKEDGHRNLRVKGLRIPLTGAGHGHGHGHGHGSGSASAGAGATSASGMGSPGAAAAAAVAAGIGLGRRDERHGASSSRKYIGGAKIEFTSEADKNEFVSMVREAQLGMIDIED